MARRISKFRQQLDEFCVAAVSVADDVERASFRFFVVIERNAFENNGFRFFGRRKNQDVAKAFAIEAAERATKILELVMGDVIAQTAVRADLVAILADSFRHVEDDGDRKAMVLAREFDERLAILGLDVGGVGNGETAGGEAFCGDEVKDFESVVCGGEIVFVVGDECAAVVGRNDLGGQKVFARERAFAGA